MMNLNLLKKIFGEVEKYNLEPRPVKAQAVTVPNIKGNEASFIVDGHAYKSTIKEDGSYESVKIGASDYSSDLSELEYQHLSLRLGENLSISQAHKIKYYLSEGLTIAQMKAKHTHAGQTEKGWSERTIKKYTGAFSMAAEKL